jgi:hypothetical protein
MGLHDVLGGLFGKKVEETPGRSPFSIKTSLLPVRMASHKIMSVDLNIKIKNMLSESNLTSIMIQVPKGMGLDQTGIAKAKEIRIGYLSKGEEKELVIPIWGHVTTEPGVYNIGVEIFSHYRTYAYIQNSIKKLVELRVV